MRNVRMTIWVMVAIVTILVFSTGAQATVVGISMISQSHHVEGYQHIFGDSGYEGEDSYIYTDSVPVSGSASGIGYGGFEGTSSSSAGNFILDAQYGADAECGAAIATSTYIFTTETESLSIIINGFVDESKGQSYRYENDVHFRFSDITAGIELEYYTADDYYDPEQSYGAYWLNWEQDYSLNPDHQYELYLYICEGPAGEGSFGHSFLNVSITPEPSTLLLLGLGAVMLRRKTRGKIWGKNKPPQDRLNNF